jgi:uncharacterized protein (TIGR03083 family)
VRRGSFRTVLTHAQYLDHLRADAARLVDAAEAAGLDAPVPTCPDWDVEQLVRHAGRPLQWAEANVGAGGQMVQPSELERPPKGAAALPWYQATARRVADVLGEADPAAVAWSWSDDHRVAFWSRRLAQETAVHRVDAQSAAGTVEPIDGELALDGIDELFTALPFHPAGGAVVGDGETIHLHCTDRDGEWLLRRDRDGLHVERAHAKGDIAAKGTASDLLLVLQSRLPIDAVQTFGDAAALERWQRDISF